jgi:peptide/nickel transport system permease protein
MSGLVRYAAGRVVQLVVMLFVASCLVFFVVQRAPGDPARMYLGTEATPAQIAAVRRSLGLDAALPVRYAFWLSRVVRLDLGKSFITGLPVSHIIMTAFGNTAQVALLATAIAVVLGLALGICAALNRGRYIDTMISAGASVAVSIPSFAIGLLLIVIVAVKLQWLPPSGGGPAGASSVTFQYMILPAMTLAAPFCAIVSRFVRVALTEAMKEDYVLTARAFGLKKWTVVNHALRNALIPTVTVAGVSFGQLLMGAMVTETVFSYPGLGYVTIQAIRNLDYPVVEGALVFCALILLLVTLLVDLTYGLLDPRVRLGRRP